jgi:hypothetical protein
MPVEPLISIDGGGKGFDEVGCSVNEAPAPKLPVRRPPDSLANFRLSIFDFG